MEYNTTRTKLLMPEYGRNVQSMVDYLLTIEDRERRQKNAEAIIELMGTLNPHLKSIEDYKHKLWDHLHQISDFKLDVDSPYPPPTPEELYKKPEPLPYPQSKIKHRHLGRNLESLIEKALEEKDPEKKQGFTQIIGYYMKLAYANWHKEPMHDDMIKNELYALTDGELELVPGGYRMPTESRPHYKSKGGNPRHKGGGNRHFGHGSGSGYNQGYNKNRKFKNKNKSS